MCGNMVVWDYYGFYPTFFISNLVGIMAYFHCQTRIQIRTRTRIPNLMAIWYYAEHVSTDSDSDLDPFPIVSA